MSSEPVVPPTPASAETSSLNREQTLHLAMKVAGVSTWEWNLQKDQIIWDESGWQLLGHAQGPTMTYQEWARLVHPDDFTSMEATVHQQLQEGGQFIVEFRYQTAEGGWLWIEGRGQVVEKDASNQPLRMLGTHTNIAARRKLEDERNASMRALDSMLQGLPDLVFRFNREGYLLSVKDDPYLIQPAPKIQGQHVNDFLNPSLAKLTREKIQLTLSTQKRQTYEYSIKIDGQERFYEARMVPLNSEEVLAIARDMTEQIRTRTALEASKRRLTAIFDIAPIGISITDEQGQLLDCNAESERLLGMSRQEQLSRNYAGKEWSIYDETGQLLKPENYVSVRALEDKKTYLNQIQEIRSRGFSSWILVSATPLNFPGYGVLIAYADINELKRAEQQLEKQKQELQTSNQELEQFAYVASHDLRQPLRMIHSYIELLAKRLENKLGDEEQKMLAFIEEGSQRMDQMLVSLLEYSRVGRKGQPLVVFNSQVSFDEACRFLAPAIQETQAKVICSHSSWPDIYASPDEMTRLFQNLLDNAIKYQPSGQVPSIQVNCTRQGNFWQFSIQDQGIGIEPSQFSRLFKVFQRLHTRSVYQGSGIGLAICRKIVERHGGKIWVVSKGSGQGSCFFFTLPVQNPAEPLG